jgi:hypothetical protein
MKLNLKAALISASLILLLHFATLAQSPNLLVSKNAFGPIVNGLLSLNLSSNANCDQTQGLIPENSRLVSENFSLRTDSSGLGTFSGFAQIVAPDGRVLTQGSLRGTVGLKARCDPSTSDNDCRAPGRLVGIFENTQVMLNFTAEPCSLCGGPVTYIGGLDGVISFTPF